MSNCGINVLTNPKSVKVKQTIMMSENQVTALLMNSNHIHMVVQTCTDAKITGQNVQLYVNDYHYYYIHKKCILYL